MDAGQGTIVAYAVEARCDFSPPQRLGTQLFDGHWQRVQFAEHPTGVSIGPSWNAPFLTLTGLCGYAAAQALRWWFLAENRDAISLETRLVKYEIAYSFTTTRGDDVAVVGAAERFSPTLHEPPAEGTAAPETTGET